MPTLPPLTLWDALEKWVGRWWVDAWPSAQISLSCHGSKRVLFWFVIQDSDLMLLKKIITTKQLQNMFLKLWFKGFEYHRTFHLEILNIFCFPKEGRCTVWDGKRRVCMMQTASVWRISRCFKIYITIVLHIPRTWGNFKGVASVSLTVLIGNAPGYSCLCLPCSVPASLPSSKPATSHSSEHAGARESQGHTRWHVATDEAGTGVTDGSVDSPWP